MKRDPLKEFVSLRQALEQRKAELETELEQINAALGSSPATSQPAPAPSETPTPRVPKGRKRAQNSMSLKDAVSAAIKSKPLSKPDILKAIGKAGYAFTAKDPMNSLNTLLYSNKAFKNQGDGTFGLA